MKKLLALLVAGMFLAVGAAHAIGAKIPPQEQSRGIQIDLDTTITAADYVLGPAFPVARYSFDGDGTFAGVLYACDATTYSSDLCDSAATLSADGTDVIETARRFWILRVSTASATISYLNIRGTDQQVKRGGTTGPACQGREAGVECSSGGIAYTSMMGAAIPQPQGDAADLRTSKFYGSTGAQFSAAANLGFADQWSAGGWVKFGSTLASGQSRGFFGMISGTPNRIECFFSYLNYGGTFGAANAVQCRIWDETTDITNFKNITWRTPFKAGEYHHLIVTYDGSAAGDPVRLFADGVMWNPDDAIVSANDVGTMANTNRAFRVGDYASASGEDISLHSLATWNVVLTPRQVADLYNGSWGVGGEDFGATHAWRFCANGDTATDDVADLVGSVNILNSTTSGTPTCTDEMTPVPPAVARIELSSGALIGPPEQGPVTGLGYVVGFGDSTMGDSPTYSSGTWTESRTPLFHLRGGWVWQNRGDGGINCADVETLVTAWIAAGANDAIGWDRSRTHVLIRCGANDAAVPVAVATSWASIVNMVDAIEAAGMKPLVLTPWPIRHTDGGCGAPDGCDAASDARGIVLFALTELMREQSLLTGIPLCDVYAAVNRLDDIDDVYPPNSADTRASALYQSANPVHQLDPDGMLFDGAFIRDYCLGDPPPFSSAGS